MLPLVTIATLTYNTGGRIIPTLDSIRAQGYPNIQHIIIDDCSTDDSVAIIKNWIKINNYNCELIVNESNKGICGTLNRLIGLAKGKYFTAIGDDIMVANKVERDITFLENNPEYAFCYSNMIIRDMSTLEETVITSRKSDQMFSDILEGKINLVTPTNTYRRAIFDEVGNYDESLSFEDLDMILRITSKYPAAYIQYFSTIYCRYPKNFHQGLVKQEYLDEVDRILAKWKDHPKYRRYTLLQKQLTFDYFSDKDKRKAVKYLPAATRLFWKKSLYKSLYKLLFR